MAARCKGVWGSGERDFSVSLIAVVILCSAKPRQNISDISNKFFGDIVACAPSMLRVEMPFHLYLKLMFLISHPKLFLKIIVPKLSLHVFCKLCLTNSDNIEGARFFKKHSWGNQDHIVF